MRKKAKAEQHISVKSMIDEIHCLLFMIKSGSITHDLTSQGKKE